MNGDGVLELVRLTDGVTDGDGVPVGGIDRDGDVDGDTDSDAITDALTDGDARDAVTEGELVVDAVFELEPVVDGDVDADTDGDHDTVAEIVAVADGEIDALPLVLGEAVEVTDEVPLTPASTIIVSIPGRMTWPYQGSPVYALAMKLRHPYATSPVLKKEHRAVAMAGVTEQLPMRAPVSSTTAMLPCSGCDPQPVTETATVAARPYALGLGVSTSVTDSTRSATPEALYWMTTEPLPPCTRASDSGMYPMPPNPTPAK